MTVEHDVVLDATADDAPRAIRTRSIVLGLVLGIPFSILFLWLATRGVDLGEVWAALRGANAGLVILAMPFVLLLFPMQGLRWRHLVEAEPRPPNRAFIALIFVGGAITNVVPGRPGDVARGIWLGRIGRIPIARSLTSVGVDRAVDVITVFVLLLLCLPFVDKPDWLMTIVIIGAALCIAATGVLVIAWAYSRRSHRGRSQADLERGDRSWVRHHASGIVRGLAVLSRPREFSLALTYSFVGWVSTIAGAWLVAEALGLRIGLAGAALAMAVMSLGSAIPSSPGMIGTYQWLAVASLGAVGVAKPDALAFSILFQAIWYIPVTLAGAPCGWWLTRYRSAHEMPRRSAATGT